MRAKKTLEEGIISRRSDKRWGWKKVEKGRK
jgi:hypothetical protein